MSAEKKLWQLSTPFRRFSAKPGPQLSAKPGSSRSRVSSVYLSDDSSTNDFIVVPEFDDEVPSLTTQESDYTSHLSELPATGSCNPLAPSGFQSYDPEPTSSQHNSYSGRGSCDILVSNTSQNDDLSQRLHFAYAHIRSMPSTPSPRVSLSSDPQVLRKQLGVPQHSVFNYPNHSAPDLPNPHTFPPELSTPPILPPPTSPDVSPGRASKNLCLRINTNVYPLSRPTSPGICQPTPATSVVTASNEPRKFLEHSMLNAVTGNTVEIPSTLSSSSKPPKRRIDRPVVPSSSFPSSRSSRRQASKGVLRKPAASSPPSPNAHRRQISLPQIRPPSPFRVDIPLHHTWHDRRTKFYSSSEYHSKISQSQEAKARRTSGSTEVLASLAWIGTPPMTSSLYLTDPRNRSASPAFFPDHFRMAIAVEDDTISDDVLVDRLEKVRRIGSPSERNKDISSSNSSVSAHLPRLGQDGGGHSYVSFSSSPPLSPDPLAKCSDIFPPSASQPEDEVSDSEDAAVWQAARKAVLCIREIVRTEKKYQEALKMLLNAETVTPPPPSMTPHVSALVRASETLLKHCLEDPSAWGVSTAFVASEDELEATMVSWCAVVGTFFTDGNEHDPQSSSSTSRWRLRKSAIILSPSSAVKQVSTPLGPQLPAVFPTISTANKIKGQAVEECRARQHPQTEQGEQVVSAPSRKSESTEIHAQPPSRKPSIRDLAIQPIQRVMRYVLLYRDLLHCTPPTSPSRLLVERALEAATRIARHCDKAQRNPAFCLAS